MPGTLDELVEIASNCIARAVGETLDKKDFAVLAVPGGETVKPIFKRLSGKSIDWERVHIFMVDERMVPLDDVSSNFNGARYGFIDYLTENKELPLTNVHPFIMDSFQKDLGVSSYTEELQGFGGLFDITLISSGSDGHIASLFPNHPALGDEGSGYIPVEDAPKSPSSRMSASRKLISSSHSIILLFAGSQKEEAYKRFLDCNVSDTDCPAKLVNKNNNVTILASFESK